MKNWFRQKLKNFLNNDKLGSNYPDLKLPKPLFNDIELLSNRESTFRFMVTNANGGVIVQYNIYDDKNDETKVCTYVIHDDEQISNRIAEIITIALLKR